MRCATHPNRDAVGICLGCGAGVCGACRVTVAGLTYCNTCLEAGRYRPPQVAPPIAETGPAIPPELLGPQNRWYLTLGVLGLLLFGIAMHLNWIGSLFWYYVPIFGMFGGSVSPTNPVTTTSLVLIGISVTFVGTAFHAYGRVLRSRLCDAAAIVSFLSAWWLLIADLLLYTGQVWLWDHGFGWGPGYLRLGYVIILYTGQILLGATFLVWASALIATRRQTRQSGLAIASGVLFIIATHFVILPLPFSAIWLLSPYVYWYSLSGFSGTFWTACLVEPASILGAILMYRSRTPK